MKDIKQYFKDFRASTPKHIQWILLGVAFLIVVILLTLVIGNRSKNAKEVATATEPVSFTMSPKSAKLTDVMVGSSKNENIAVSVNTPVVIESVEFEGKQPDGLKQKTDCKDLTSSCLVNVVYKPTSVVSESKAKLILTWHTTSQEEVSNTEEIEVIYGSVPEKVVESKPDSKPIVEPEPIV